jgi:hypothetical protein
VAKPVTLPPGRGRLATKPLPNRVGNGKCCTDKPAALFGVEDIGLAVADFAFCAELSH